MERTIETALEKIKAAANKLEFNASKKTLSLDQETFDQLIASNSSDLVFLENRGYSIIILNT